MVAVSDGVLLGAVLVGLLAVVILQLIATARARGSGQQFDQALAKIDARLDEQGKRGDHLTGQVSAAQAKQLEKIQELRVGVEQRQAEISERVQRQVGDQLKRSTEDLAERMKALSEATDKRLLAITGQVDKRLSEGFDKTNSTFTDVVKRLSLIDQAQKKITELSTNVVSLQEVLADRTSRGTFGEVQLEALVSNLLPAASFQMQFVLSNGKRVDCMLFLPEPTGNVPIDSKFPLENYRRKVDSALPDETRKQATRDFARDVQTHIDDVAAKYILPGETADGAVLFLPAEAVFAEIHSAHPELVERAQRLRVWLTSPTTLMAVLTTARSVMKDAATRREVVKIQEHLRMLAKDFERFGKRMDNLSTHIQQAGRDVDEVHKSAKKISSRFEKIDELELSDGEAVELPLPEPELEDLRLEAEA